ncbi:HIT family protein [Pararhizobium sp. BT-229]|uniref:HIT family protein n=1 Tax=Pararhizobium sp. BT-229 TaxID=2986923 RepID=UPI0021F6A492|nr:HIT family protein [Pararhizobium sp. BT-229]MCV9964860.1 HIT family protein [Pararhizobium sp. BT-229]
MKFEQSIFHPENPWFIAETPLSYLVLNFDQTYPGRAILVPKAEKPDLESVGDEDIGPLMLEVATVGRVIKEAFKADRMNYASLGNVVGQLHWHIIPRYEGDVNWGGPPWPITSPREPDDAERRSIIERIRDGLVQATR